MIHYSLQTQEIVSSVRYQAFQWSKPTWDRRAVSTFSLRLRLRTYATVLQQASSWRHRVLQALRRSIPSCSDWKAITTSWMMASQFQAHPPWSSLTHGIITSQCLLLVSILFVSDVVLTKNLILVSIRWRIRTACFFFLFLLKFLVQWYSWNLSSTNMWLKFFVWDIYERIHCQKIVLVIIWVDNHGLNHIPIEKKRISSNWRPSTWRRCLALSISVLMLWWESLGCLSH